MLLMEGDVINLPAGVEVLTVNHPDFNSWEIVKIGVTVINGVVVCLPGEFVVTNARATSDALGRYEGHEVCAKRLSDSGDWNPGGVLVLFYDSGEFAAKIQGLVPHRKMKRVYVPAKE